MIPAGNDVTKAEVYEIAYTVLKRLSGELFDSNTPCAWNCCKQNSKKSNLINVFKGTQYFYNYKLFRFIPTEEE
jgi:hypothetical protein